MDKLARLKLPRRTPYIPGTRKSGWVRLCYYRDHAVTWRLWRTVGLHTASLRVLQLTVRVPWTRLKAFRVPRQAAAMALRDARLQLRAAVAKAAAAE
jgi:hypothetical protein